MCEILRMPCFFMLLIVAMPVTGNQYYTHTVLQPLFQGERLSYCMLGKGGCGDVVAQKYCRLLGYKRANKHIKANNVGLTNYIEGHWKCKGWRCDSFEQIRCVDDLPHPPAEPYHYRNKHFAFPRFNNYRVAWCYKHHSDCGYKAAYAFCRQQGYMKVKHYEKETHVAATKTLGDNALCFGNSCDSFREIQCQR